MEDIVVGSGPAGVSAAWALLKQGRTVTMLDVGEQLESEQEELRLRLAGNKPKRWSEADVAAYTNPRTSEKIDTIRPFGSDFLFRDSVGFFNGQPELDSVGLRPSFARGGLSNGWGSSILPYSQGDINDWPVAARQLKDHYVALRDFMPMAGSVDDLQALFPMLPMAESNPLPLSSQARIFLERLKKKKAFLNRRGIYFGQARQAVLTSGCQDCGMCLYGCPYGVIYNAAHTLEKLLLHPSFTYLKGNYVERFEERGATVTLWVKDLVNNESVTFSAKRLFVACGVLPTSRLVMNSLGVFGKPVTMKDSQHFYLPLLHSWRPRPDPRTEAINSLVQIFIEILGAGAQEKMAHVQVYTYNNLYAVDMRKRFGPFANILAPLISQLSRRLLVAQGFLHSDYSAQIDLCLVKSGEKSTLQMRKKPNAHTDEMISAVRKKITKLSVATGLLPLLPLSRPGSIGSSFHCGSTFPMAEQPQGLDSDSLGRPAGLSRVFIVDASVLPSIPATTITLSVMANAHRIATESIAVAS